VITASHLARLLALPPPTDEQAAVIESPLAPAVVIAGAGSGKTETMAARVVWLVANRHVTPAQVLGLTFTRKAAAELGRRIRWRLTQWRHLVEREQPDDTEHVAELLGGEPTVLTYAAYAGRLVGEHAMRVGAEPNPRLLSQAVCWQLADSVSRRYSGELPRGIGALASVAQYVLGLTAQLADHLVEPDAVDEFCTKLADRLNAVYGGEPAATSEAGALQKSLRHRAALLPLVREYAATKAAVPSVDFGDQMALAARLAQLPEVARIERERFGAVLLDEYQDTGHAQAVTLAGLFGAGHPVTAVGDPFQSIYGWRGASAGNIGRFATTFPMADGRPACAFPLSTSWRNDEQILHAANAVAAALRTGAATVELRSRPGAGEGRIIAAVTETVEAEGAWLAGRMRAEWDAMHAGDRTAAVLVRRRSQIDQVRVALLAEGLPVEVVGLGGLLTTPEIVDVVATLRVLADHKSGSALARLLTGARWRIGPRDLAALSDRARELARRRRTADTDEIDQGSLIEALDDLGPAERYSMAGGQRMQALSAELRALRRRLSAPLAELVAEVERMIGIDVEVAARADRAAIGRVHLDRFLDEAANFAADADEATLTAFLAFLDAAEVEENGLDVGEVAVERERVQILTVHGAKGLEWDVVAVPGLVSGVFPADPKSVDWTRTRQLLPAPLRGDHAELPALPLDGAADRKQVRAVLQQHAAEVRARHQREERRLAYVAFTRARSVLLMSGYAWDTAKTARTISPFLDELRSFAEIDEWFVPDDGAENPLLGVSVTAPWPIDPLGARREDVQAGAELVRAALAAPTVVDTGPALLPGLLDDTASRQDFWRRSVDILLAERARLAAGGTVEVALPGQLSVSQLVALQRDAGGLARRLRRPLPSRPAPLARRGTAFHAWLEQRWSAQTLLDVDDLPGAADATADDSDLVALRAAFEASAWAERTPAEVEVPFEMAIEGTVVRGRMDAVFAEPDGEFTVVDWKTGVEPQGSDAQAAAVQLAAYRLAWAALSGADVERIGAAFHHVRSNETISPVDLLDAIGLRRLIAGRPPAPADRLRRPTACGG
jgi:DNA helicase-2/ATP-dependent DNA helicase PcrA